MSLIKINLNKITKVSEYQNYQKYYDDLFYSIKHKEMNILEIRTKINDPEISSEMVSTLGGCNTKYSFKECREYFCNSHIYNYDINPKILFKDEYNISFILDKKSVVYLETQICNIDRTYDVIIVSGLYNFTTNWMVLQTIYKKLNLGGIYIIEDIYDFDKNLFYCDPFRKKILDNGDMCKYTQITNTNNEVNNIITVQKTNIITKSEKVISFCLWGHDEKYIRGLVANIQLAKLYYPDWTCLVYIHESTYTSNFAKELSKYDNIKVIIKKDRVIDSNPTRFMLWRLEPVVYPFVKYLMPRNTESRISPREVLSVQEWLESGKTLHIMRDHIYHYPYISGGMYGIKISGLPLRQNTSWSNIIDKFYNEHNDFEIDEQFFLTTTIYNLIKNDDRIIHDEIKKYEGQECRPFPIPFEQNGHYIGCCIYPDGSTKNEYVEMLQNWLHINAPHRINSTSVTFEQKLISIAKNINRIYVMHYTKLTDRKKSLQKQLKNTLLDRFITVEWVENFDREDITTEQIEKGYRYDHYILYRKLTKPEIANGLAHYHIIEKIKERNEVAFVIEDDTIFKKNFVNHLYNALMLLPKEWEFINLGGPTVDLFLPNISLPNMCKNDFPSTDIFIHKPSTPAPCTVSSFLLNGVGAKKLLSSKYMKPFSEPIDFAIWRSAIEKNLYLYWCQPWITYEGSKYTEFSTTLERGF